MRETILAALKEYQLNNMAYEDEPDNPYQLVHLFTAPGRSLENGEEELFMLADFIAAKLTFENAN